MGGFTKLYGELIGSTIWRENLQTKVVWITMLALANKDGEVKYSIPGLAHDAGVEVEECEQALAKFLAPDKYSRTKDHEGRRIAEIPGGWLLLNYKHYRQLGMQESRKDFFAEQKRKQREREKCPRTVLGQSSDRFASASASDTLFSSFWALYPLRKGKKNAQKAFAAAIQKVDFEVIKEAIARHSKSRQWTDDGGKYIPHPATWLNQERWTDELEPVGIPQKPTQNCI